MNTFERIKRLIKDIKPELDMDRISLKDSLTADLGFDFLDYSMLKIVAEDEFNLAAVNELNLSTVEDLCDYVDDVRCDF